MTTIQDTVRMTLNDHNLSSYFSQARPVIEMLVSRELRISEQLLTAAADRDIDVDEVRSLLTELGMEVPEPEPETEPEEFELLVDEDETPDSAAIARIEQALSGIASRLDNLEAVARRYGASV